MQMLKLWEKYKTKKKRGVVLSRSTFLSDNLQPERAVMNILNTDAFHVWQIWMPRNHKGRGFHNKWRKNSKAAIDAYRRKKNKLG